MLFYCGVLKENVSWVCGGDLLPPVGRPDGRVGSPVEHCVTLSQGSCWHLGDVTHEHLQPSVSTLMEKSGTGGGGGMMTE